MRPLLTALAVAVLLASTTVFVLFERDSARIGGSALGGSSENGRYLVVDHGRTREVTAGEYGTNRLLGILALSLLPLGMAAIAWMLFAEVLPRAVFLGDEAERARTVKRVLRSGEAIAEGRVGGRLGWANYGGPMLRVSVHPGGFHVKPLWMDAFAVERERIRSVARRRILFQKRLEIVHDSRDVRSPLLLDAAEGSPLAAALEGLAEA